MSDLISRQAAIDVLEIFTQTDALGHTPKQIVEALPSAQPELSDEEKRLIKQLRSCHNGSYAKVIDRLVASAQPEIVRCKDCKHWDGVDACDVIDAPVWDDDFCSMAERRSDE